MKFSVKMYFKIILKVSKNQGFTFSLDDIFFEKPQGVNLTPRHLRIKVLLFLLCADAYLDNTTDCFYKF